MKKYLKYFYYYQIYLILGLLFIIFTPVLDLVQVPSLSYTFSYFAFVLIIIATLKAIWDQLENQQSRKLLEKSAIFLKKKIIKRIKK